MKCDPQKEHEWLQQLIGTWKSESDCIMGPDKPPMKTTGGEVVRSMGGLWVLADGHMTMPDGDSGTMLMTLGYDPQKKRYVGSWVGSMMTRLWVYDGSLDPTGKILTLNTEGPSFTDENKLSSYRDVIEILGPNDRTLSSHAQGDDGTWNKFMTAHYHRVSS
jgi:hypothetical protein